MSKNTKMKFNYNKTRNEIVITSCYDCPFSRLIQGD